MNPVDQYLLKQKEPYQSVMLYVRSVITRSPYDIQEKYKYGIPFYTYKNKSLIYLNILKGTKYVDVAFLQGAVLKARFPELKDYNNRKQVRSLQVHSLEAFDEMLFNQILEAAVLLVDEKNK